MLDFSRTLFICTGNVFRSVTAEKLFQKRADFFGLNYQTRSRGIELFYKKSSPVLSEILEKKYDVNLKSHSPQKVTAEDIGWSTSVVCFTEEQLQSVKKQFPLLTKNKIYLISDISGLDYRCFGDVDYKSVSEGNPYLFKVLDSISIAVSCMIGNNLSIVMAVYNEEKNILNILKKLLNQSRLHNVKEIIIVSSGSYDNTDSIISSFDSPIIHHIKEYKRTGKINALKVATDFVSGKFVLLIDGDVDIGDNFIKKSFFYIKNGQIPFSAKVLPLKCKENIFYRIAVLGCESWHRLRLRASIDKAFVYPTGYAMFISKEQFSKVRFFDKTIINDDAFIATSIFESNKTFNYCPDVNVYVLFPDNFLDFMRQKVRTRMGRRQIKVYFFKEIESNWRKELLNNVDFLNIPDTLFLLSLDFFARQIASILIKFKKNPNLWSMVNSTKYLQKNI